MAPYSIDYDKAVEIAEAQIPYFKVKEIVLPSNPDKLIYLVGTSDVALVRNRANRVYLHPETYAVMGVQNAKEIGIVNWLNDVMDLLHFGNWGGLTTKLIWFLFGLGISILIFSGMWINLKRVIKNVKNFNSRKLGEWKFVNLTIVSAVVVFMYYSLINKYSLDIYLLSIISFFTLLLYLPITYLFTRKNS